jgi:hypothetical protein
MSVLMVQRASALIFNGSPGVKNSLINRRSLIPLAPSALSFETRRVPFTNAYLYAVRKPALAKKKKVALPPVFLHDVLEFQRFRALGAETRFKPREASFA